MFNKLNEMFRRWRAKGRTSPTKNQSIKDQLTLQIQVESNLSVPATSVQRSVTRPTQLFGLPVSVDGIEDNLPPKVQGLLDRHRPLDSDEDEKFDFELALKAMKMLDRINKDEPLSPDSVLLTPSLGWTKDKDLNELMTPKIPSPIIEVLPNDP